MKARYTGTGSKDIFSIAAGGVQERAIGSNGRLEKFPFQYRRIPPPS
jgi:hypothetical protein